MIVLPYVLLVVWFALVIKGADFLVDGASSLAKKLRISDLVIGLTVVAFGTSAPELIVNAIGSINGSNDMVLWNIIWSNISNILLILWITAGIKSLSIEKSTIWKEIPFALLGSLVLGILINDQLFNGWTISVLSGADGVILLLFFGIFMYYTFNITKNGNHQEDASIQEFSHLKSVFFIIGWMAWLAFGWNLVVDNAVSLATMRWWSEKLIGLTILAIGTSLPELATSIAAVRKSKASMAVGNIVGSNIFNVFFVLWITSLISPVTFNPANNIDIVINIIVHILLFAILFVWKKRTLQRWQGVLFVVLYLVFLWGMFWLG